MKASSQWNFGELFSSESMRRVWTVGELTASIKQLLERQFGQVWISGEITNLRQQSSGHIYFTLKDAAAQLNCVLFRGDARSHRDLIADGQKVLLQGDLTVYEPRGQYQLLVKSVELQGTGALQLAFERLKRKLQAEGLFEPARKRPLPPCPNRIGVVTSLTGAALRDVLHVIQRRNPFLELILAPCRVQGDGAAPEIAGAIQRLNQLDLDLVLVTRGGGSLEDLWAFNEEIVARAIAASRLPVVSAVGHEIDFTIGDFVADLRAATPSAAAELLTEGSFARRQLLVTAPDRLRQQAQRRWDLSSRQLLQASGRLLRRHPRRLLQNQWQRIDECLNRLLRVVRERWKQARNTMDQSAQRLGRVRPTLQIARRRELLLQLQNLMLERLRQQFRLRQSRWTQAQTRLELLSPLAILSRGYSITRDASSGRILRSANDVRDGQALITRLHQGEVRSVVKSASV
ncbi:MAG TPA: exodeoxyribonuclease VII large subunit [Candidatus Paceibacterota bacterium]|nr:exodeoxyribonuclease VII large subunit [Candidatus Paceibacterota bacterium]